MQVRAADRGRGHPHDRVSRGLDLRVRDLLDFEFLYALPCQCLHISTLGRVSMIRISSALEHMVLPWAV